MLNERYIFGAGNNGKNLYKKLEEYGIETKGFIDNDLKKQSQSVFGKTCISIAQAKNLGALSATILVSPNDHEDIEIELCREGFQNVYPGYKILTFIPEIYDTRDYEYVTPFDGYESPYPDIIEIHKKEKELFSKDKDIVGINFNIERQLELAKLMSGIELIDWIEKTKKNRYYYENDWFRKGSADILCYMMRILKPKKIIEVGSGFSTAVMMDTNECFFNNAIEIISIEPYASRLKAVLKEGDKIDINKCFLQDIETDFFNQLQENDILFIDSSHISRMNSDVNYLFFEILPRLKKAYIYTFMIYFILLYILSNGFIREERIVRCTF